MQFFRVISSLDLHFKVIEQAWCGLPRCFWCFFWLSEYWSLPALFMRTVRLNKVRLYFLP